MKKTLIAVVTLVIGALVIFAQDDKPAPAFNWDQAPVDMVYQAYMEQTGRTVLVDPNAPKPQITLKSREGQKLTNKEYVEAIEVVLEMHGIHLENYRDKFVRAVPRNKARKEGIPLIMDMEKLGESGRVVSMMIPFKNISTDEAKQVLEGFRSDSGILLVLERTNSILVTDTEQNIRRMQEIARTIDIASPVLENVYVVQIKNAAADEIKTALDKIVEESMKEQEKNAKGSASRNLAANQVPNRGLRTGANPAPNATPAAAANESLAVNVSDADRGMIRGKVLILADERSNKLIIVTMKANMDFFNKVIEQLDVETTPDVKVEVVRLKYADAEEVADMINDLIGNSASAKNSSKGNQNGAARTGSGANITSGRTTTAKPSVNQRSGESKAGELSKDNVTVLADKRINGLVIMARTEDMPTIRQIIDEMDVKLAQVLIETVIIEVGLGDDIQTGMDWVHGMNKKGDIYHSVIGGGGGTLTPSASSSEDDDGEGSAATAVGRAIFTGATGIPAAYPQAAGLSYFTFSKKLDLAAVIQASKSDSHSKYLASPIIMTVDNKEATIKATQMRYLLKGFTSTSSYYGTATPDYEQKEIGLTVKVTPKINPNGTVMLKVEETYSQVGEDQSIQATTGVSTDSKLTTVQVPTTITREMQADVSLENRQTVVLGGLTETLKRESTTGIPILKDIPYIGKYLFGSTVQSETRKELLVFMTPYVLNDGKEAQDKAAHLKSVLSDTDPWQDRGWSESPLADPVEVNEKLRRQKEKWAREDRDYNDAKELEALKDARVKDLIERAKKDGISIDELNQAEEKKAEERAEAEAERRDDVLKILEETEEKPAAEVPAAPVEPAPATPANPAPTAEAVPAPAEEVK